ncbi:MULTISPECIES: hypothetical protein [unclassified Curtobacterium]|uniref:hypothetical protein n=1 Tax=unclassified Curtobacterium TaxID=257496 RepID=UPI000DA84CC0|nr:MULTISPECIES: hypothetical protein [unclassified Curtobacterium]PZE65704.1 hypothetical protein DEI83_09240 [Curtobacterium sp. MCBD17_021]WIB25122.1 hypothetical protein DEJ18_08515 [Curtobacterium sp. MCSS17_015]
MHDDDLVEDTVLRPRGRHALGNDPDDGPSVAATAAAVRPSVDGSAADPSTAIEDTVVRPVHRPATPSVQPGVPAVPAPSGASAPSGAPAPDRAPPRDPRHGSDESAPTRTVPSVRIAGRVLRLDRPVLVGRHPSPPRVALGPVPELVMVPSPTGLVSSSHLLVHAAGATAVVDDLHSTNGTVVRSPGAPPHRMPAGASMVVLTGTVVDIGDGNTIEVLSPFVRSVPPGGRDSSGPWPSPPSSTGPSHTPRERS